MAKNRKSYTEEFKHGAVRLMETSGKSIAQIARDLDVNYNLLYRWRGLYGSSQPPSSNGSPPSLAELEAELKRLRRENEVLRQERDILKKAMHIVSRSQP